MSAAAVRVNEAPRDPIAAVTHPDPYPYYAQLVAARPFHRDETLGLWVAGSASAVTDVLGDPACLVRPPAEPVPRPLLGTAAGAIFGRLVRMNEGERHAAFKPAVSAVTSGIEAPVREQAKRWAGYLVKTVEPARDPARLDRFVFSLSAYVLADMLGVTPDRLADTAALVGDFARSIAPAATGEQQSRGSYAAGELIVRFTALLDARGDAAPPTLLGDLDREVGRAGRADRDDVVANGIGFLSQAYEATAGLIGNTLVTLGRLRLAGSRAAERSEIAAIVHEVVRYDPPVQNTRRFVARDTTIGGQPLKAGDVVLVVVAAANRDPLANPEPSRFDPARTSRQAFTFGAGPHACPGEAIATAIAEAGVAALLVAGVEPARLVAKVTYRASGNTRVPIFDAGGPIG
jgi:cytochrome P450